MLLHGMLILVFVGKDPAGKRKETLMAKQGSAVSFGRENLDDVIAQIRAIDERLDEVRGTQAQRLATARLAVLDDSPTVTIDPVSTPPSMDATFGSLVEWIEGDLADWLAEVENAAEEAVTGWLVGHKSAHEDEVTSLKEQRTTLVEQAKAFLTLLPTMGIDVSDVEIPKRSGGGRPAGSSSVKVSGAHFYTVIGGKRKDYQGVQDKFSSVAWYQGASLCPDCPTANGDKGVSVKHLRQAVEQALGAPIPATPWSVELNGNTIGMEVLSDEDAEGAES